MNRHRQSRNPDTALGHRRVRCRFADLDVRNDQFPVARGSFVTRNDHDASDETRVFALEKHAVPTTLKYEPNDAVHMPRNTLPSYSACSAYHRCSPCEQENDRPACNCSIKNHRNHYPTRESEAGRPTACLASASPITKRYRPDRMFSSYRKERTYGPSSMEDWMEKRRRGCSRGGAWRIVLLFLNLCLFATTCNAENRCAVGLKTPGWTWPQGDIVLENGQSLKILCVLNKTFIDENYPGKNASDLVFFHNKNEMQPEFISIVNETTISMDVQKPPPADDVYYCKLRLNKNIQQENNKVNDVAVCLNKVVIGFPPLQPKNFTCVSYNWERLTCKWTPAENYIFTKFTLMFLLPGRASRRKVYFCPINSSSPPNTCIWDATTNPIYRQPYQTYTFLLNAENVLGNVTFTYKFNHYAHVIPSKPANLSVVNKTSNSIYLHWSAAYPMQNFPSGLHHRILYQSQLDHRDIWKIINLTDDIHEDQIYFNLTGLPYANSMYDVRVCMKSAAATGEDRWSNFSELTFRTEPTLPSFPPRATIGSFEVSENNGNRDVYLYWQTIPKNQENGNNFKYEISHVEEGGRKVEVAPQEITKTYARFKGLSFLNYRFEVRAVNDVGATKDSTKIFVPSQRNMPDEPIAFTKIAFDDRLYELSWKPPSKTKIANYTIFWCNDERDRPYQCTGYLDWAHVSNNITMYNVTVPKPNKVYQFAISANSEEGSSGMVWASCTVIHRKVVGKMKSVWINRIGAYFIEVGWRLDCSDRIGIVEGFKIYYCPIMSPYNLNCKGPKLNTTIRADPHTIHGIIDNLKPYTTYMLSVAVLTKNSEGLHSDPLYNTTLEAAPSTPPQDVKIINVTNTTMFITWKPPKAMNGVLRYYEVYYNGLSQKVEDAVKVELKNLLAYKTYNVSVAACTVSCSTKSPTIHKATEIGVPGKIGVPTVRFINSSQVIVKWDRPQETAGPLRYYEIKTNDNDIYNSTQTDVQLPISDCKTVSQEKRYQFRIRGVNIAINNQHLKGAWSEPGEGNCYSDGPSSWVWIIIWVSGSLGVVVLLAFTAYGFKSIWMKCRAMQDVEVKLPPGLAPNMKLLQKVSEQHIRQPSADSSGCSSGQESVTSSLTADSQVSSDSGTEVDPVPPDKLLETLPTWESNSLRQRNVGVARPNLAADTAHWDTYIKVNKSGEPLMGETVSLARSTPNLTDSTGYTTQHTWSSTGYISMPSSEELSNNSSPVPRENPNVTGYSVVGILPNSIRIKPEDGGDTTDNDALIMMKPKKSAIPYVTLAAMEQRQRGQPADIFGDLNKLAFDPSKVVSQPYLQTGFVDILQQPFTLNSIDLAKSNSMCDSFASTSLIDSCGKPFVSPFATSSTSSLATPNTLVEPSSSKSFVFVSPVSGSPVHVTADKESASQKPYVWQVPVSSENPLKPYVLMSSLQGTQRPEEEEDEEEQVGEPMDLIMDYEDDEKSDKSDEEDATYLALSWQEITADEETRSIKLEPDKIQQNTGYIAIAKEPNLEQQQTSVITETPSDERFEKTSPSSQTTIVPRSTDESYSKVAVMPSTIQ